VCFGTFAPVRRVSLAVGVVLIAGLSCADRDLTLTVCGVSGVPSTNGEGGRIVSRGSVVFGMSRDPVGAPLFYRDVPLMPSRTREGIVKPLAPAAIPLVTWRLRDVSKPESRVVMEKMPTCANCHSFATDGRRTGSGSCLCRRPTAC